MIVTDTNLIVYLYVHGQHTARAEDVLRRDAAWGAPLLWRSEFRNALVGLVRRGSLGPDDATRVVSDAEHLLAGSEYSVASTFVLQLALRSGCSAYDCEFVALALDLDVPLITTDRQVLKAFPDTAVSPEDFVGVWRYQSRRGLSPGASSSMVDFAAARRGVVESRRAKDARVSVTPSPPAAPRRRAARRGGRPSRC